MQDTVRKGGGKRKKKPESEMGDMESRISEEEAKAAANYTFIPPPWEAGKGQFAPPPVVPDQEAKPGARQTVFEHEGRFLPAMQVPPEERKIAVCGSAVSSVGLVPYNDPTWEIWACSPANKGAPRVDVWFELHNPDLKIREGLLEWMNWLKEQPIVYMQKAYPGYKGAREFPLAEIMKRWGPFWWTSQLAYMMALAIEQNPKVIGLYGVDMAANSEYNQQRLGCQYFIQHIVRDSKIELVVPPESDILERAPLYGYCESSRQWRKYYARKAELVGRINTLSHDLSAKESEKTHLVGALDDMEYQMAHWGNRMDFVE